MFRSYNETRDNFVPGYLSAVVLIAVLVLGAVLAGVLIVVLILGTVLVGILALVVHIAVLILVIHVFILRMSFYAVFRISIMPRLSRFIPRLKEQADDQSRYDGSRNTAGGRS